MDFLELLNNKNLKPKEKTETISHWILKHPEKLNELIDFAAASKDVHKATCIEALEYVSKTHPNISSLACFNFAAKSLTDKAPRVKWESARVIGNIAKLYPDHLDETLKNLLVNSEHTGTVVRWSTAYAFGEIIKLKTSQNKDLIPAIEAICEREEKNSIRKIYLDALKKAKA